MMWGNLLPTQDEVSVPYLQPSEEGTLSVELTAPEEAGEYRVKGEGGGRV